MKKLILILFISLFTVSASPSKYFVDMYDMGNGITKIVITDLCGVEYSTAINSDEMKTSKPLEWLENLLKSRDFNKCIDS